MMRLHEFYRRFAALPPEKRNVLLTEVRHDPLTPFVIYKQLEYARQMQTFYTSRVEELLRIADETFNQVEQ
jgi:hypothetical protein